ncbi:diaminopimelate decarboxylase [Gracilimonas mengyeensis]|uniref:Diaminopimelate decarboxylase n=1 Tax=Gracilimonas mengyeensis TaxID=1302730 RepID=A0A521DFI1_9BACT|nr:diaminopimelate decarboxylase [Gracilimonas mengyeensis]SMO70467.1 diaminopimelate decarboxylase [Gracilimonas mengyeensis]
MFPSEVTDYFRNQKTPFYFYDLDVLNATLDQIKKHGLSKGYHIHFALKANNQLRMLETIRDAGLGADCVSGGEINRALEAGFAPDDIAFAGVGKSDEEMELGLKHDIFCFNCESLQELKVLNELAGQHGKTARIALRLNPNVEADTHEYITTGLNENKFGINESELDTVLELLPKLENLELIGIHFHIGSQIENMKPFRELCDKANRLNNYIEGKGFELTVINVGGGFGINYDHPNEHAIPDFERFFGLFEQHITLKPHQNLHFELGRSVTGQCGSLITEVLFTKTGQVKNFAVVDAGMTELIRPALYKAAHRIDVLTSNKEKKTYDVVGPICESSDTFRKGVELPEVQRGDIIAIRSAGAYGEVMRSAYNLRPENPSVYSDEIVSAVKK